MYVAKRDGRIERFSLYKLDGCISKLTFGLHPRYVQARVVSRRVADSLRSDLDSCELAELAAEMAASLVGAHPDYGILAARISIGSLHKAIQKRFSAVIWDLYHNIDPQTQKPAPLVSEAVFRNVQRHAEEVDSAIVHGRDEDYDYFTLEESVKPRLLRTGRGNQISERPQHMLMRTAMDVHGDDVADAIQTYAAMSKRLFMLPLPNQLLPSFALDMADDSVDGIFSTLKTCAQTLPRGNLGLGVQRVRANGSCIAGTDGTAKGIGPMLRVFNDAARLGGASGSLVVYLEPWHADVFDFLNLGRSGGKDELRARDLAYALWVPDLFMRRVDQDGDWTLMCPAECPGLVDCYAGEFDALYEQYEGTGRGRRTLKARALWSAVVEMQMETGGPSVLYKDACNVKSNQKHLGPVRGSGPHAELMQAAAPGEASSCAQAALHLPAFVCRGAFDFDGLHHAAQVLARSLDKMLDAAPAHLQRRRPLGIGADGLADAFLALGLPFDSPPARQLNVRIFETVYHAALTASAQMAKAAGAPHPAYAGSPAAAGLLQHDLCGVTPTALWDWAALRRAIATHGVRNSVLVALPGAEALSPAPSQLVCRRGRSGSGHLHAFNPHLVRALAARGLWSADVRAQVAAAGGSVQALADDRLPASVKALFRTAAELGGQRAVLQLAADRAPFVDQSQAVAVAMPRATPAKVAAMHFFGWRAGLKTGCSSLGHGARSPLVPPESPEAAHAARQVLEDTAAAACARVRLGRPGADGVPDDGCRVAVFV
ncbi:putative ribonucleotide reductase large subunit [Diplodia seriata]|uniref:Ribonucleoside-diphosphate reductase n=1 Tax=Diplodia seriata TaxID=420778 RepID=A0A0G2EYB4_9PEZI|nr:putative ribonucleotide reductase large subunit [Diplodia seriata]